MDKYSVKPEVLSVKQSVSAGESSSIGQNLVLSVKMLFYGSNPDVYGSKKGFYRSNHRFYRSKSGSTGQKLVLSVKINFYRSKSDSISQNPVLWVKS
ncbi:hypothetical protein [Bacillus litorisediminis]|uniref:hypothetical protein n=1 Tax=Bacillus litorisediminis TaxID=2922713 RepID=UPI001FAF2F0C|nr:hypothetical protein [Bacillus litorisediminis]